MSKFQTKTINKLKKNGWKVLKIIRLNENGYPDLMALKKGVTIFVEIKEKEDTLKPLQEFRAKELIKNGFNSFVEQDGKESELDRFLKK